MSRFIISTNVVFFCCCCFFVCVLNRSGEQIWKFHDSMTPTRLTWQSELSPWKGFFLHTSDYFVEVLFIKSTMICVYINVSYREYTHFILSKLSLSSLIALVEINDLKWLSSGARWQWSVWDADSLLTEFFWPFSPSSIKVHQFLHHESSLTVYPSLKCSTFWHFHKWTC